MSKRKIGFVVFSTVDQRFDMVDICGVQVKIDIFTADKAFMVLNRPQLFLLTRCTLQTRGCPGILNFP